MNKEPLEHKQLKSEFKKLLKPFKAESMADKCADIVLRERMKILTIKSHSDQSTGEWRSINPHDPRKKHS